MYIAEILSILVAIEYIMTKDILKIISFLVVENVISQGEIILRMKNFFI